MLTKEDLQAISEIMDKKFDEKLTPITSDIQSMTTDIQSTKTDIQSMQKDIRTLKHDMKEIGWKVDVLYDWVDTVDLKVKKIEDKTA